MNAWTYGLVLLVLGVLFWAAMLAPIVLAWFFAAEEDQNFFEYLFGIKPEKDPLRRLFRRLRRLRLFKRWDK